VSYQVQLAADADKLLFAEGQGSFSLTKTCQGWTLGEVFQFAIEKGTGGAPKRIGPTADRIEERLTAKESADGATLTYQRAQAQCAHHYRVRQATWAARRAG
jgi:hypothetical protein